MKLRLESNLCITLVPYLYLCRYYSGLFRVLNRWVLIAFDPRPPWPWPPVQGPPAHVTFSPQIKCPVLHAAQLLSHINWIFAFYCSGKMLLLMYHINLLIPKSSLLWGNFATSAKDIWSVSSLWIFMSMRWFNLAWLMEFLKYVLILFNELKTRSDGASVAGKTKISFGC